MSYLNSKASIISAAPLPAVSANAAPMAGVSGRLNSIDTVAPLAETGGAF